MKESRLTCIGVGDGGSCSDRRHAAFLYQFDRASLLVDCGEPVDGSLKAGGVSCNAIDGIFISHLHADHIGGFFMLLQGFHLQGRRKELPVYLPASGIKPLREMLKATLLFHERLGFRLRFSPLKPGKPHAVRGIRVTAFPTTHLHRTRGTTRGLHLEEFSSFCFLLQTGRQRIGHSADLGSATDLEPLLAMPLDLLVCEMAHFGPEEIFSYLSGRRIKRVVFVHLAEVYWRDLTRVRRLAAKILPNIPHSFARDGSVISCQSKVCGRRSDGGNR